MFYFSAVSEFSDVFFFFQYATPAFSSGISASSTATLTPTTLSTLEQTFIELQSVPSRTVQNPITQSGFVPPIVHSAMQSDNDIYSDSSSNGGDDYLPSAPKKVKIGDKTTTIMSKYEIENPQRKTHRRQIRDEEVNSIYTLKAVIYGSMHVLFISILL